MNRTNTHVAAYMNAGLSSVMLRSFRSSRRKTGYASCEPEAPSGPWLRGRPQFRAQYPAAANPIAGDDEGPGAHHAQEKCPQDDQHTMRGIDPLALGYLGMIDDSKCIFLVRIPKAQFLQVDFEDPGDRLLQCQHGGGSQLLFQISQAAVGIGYRPLT